jgi:hypothetical protein
MTARTPARPHYDAVVDLYPPQTIAECIYGLVKLTYDVSTGSCVLADPVALEHDLRNPDIDPPLKPGSDFWLHKQATDIVVLGSAHSPFPVSEMKVSLTVGDRRKSIAVIGRRLVRRDHRGNLSFSSPEPFSSMQLGWRQAYGGCDRTVEYEPPTTLAEHLRLMGDHPGLYPRNPLGHGYVVHARAADGVELPNVEHPRQRLHPENLVVADPCRWYLQPVPVGLGWTFPIMFPRYVYLGTDAWFPAPNDQRLPEIRSGQISPDDLDPTRVHDCELPSAYFQEAPFDQQFVDLRPGTPIAVRGMHPSGKPVSFHLPPPPRTILELEGRVQTIRPVLTNLVIEPEREQVSCTYLAVTTKMHRAFIPGIHGHIPLSLRVEDDDPIVYDTPVPIRTQVLEASRS